MEYQTTIALDFDSENTSCYQSTDGSATAVASGSSDYSYQWVNGPSSNQWSGVGAGTYVLNVTDLNGCTAQGEVSIDQPNPDVVSFSWNTAGLMVEFSNSSSAGSYLWDFGDGNTSTEANPTHTYSETGTYSVCLELTTDCGVKDVCNTLSVNNASIDENYWDYISVYPNPTTSMVYFSITHPEISTIKIIDVVGKEIYRMPVSGQINAVDLSTFDNGSYFFNILDASGKILLSDKLLKVK